MLAYVVMPRYGFNLEYWLDKRRQKVSTSTILDIGLRLIRFFQKVHYAGYVYNDLKPDNIMLAYGEKPPKQADWSVLEGIPLHLVDFGFSSRY